MERFIYALCDPDGTIRYVGATVNLVARESYHRGPSSFQWGPFEGWRKPMRLSFRVIVLEVAATREETAPLERRWIEALRARGCPLLNMQLPKAPAHPVASEGGFSNQRYRL